MYGFRGSSQNADLLSSFEMLIRWSLDQIEIPHPNATIVTSAWTEQGKVYLSECKECKQIPKPKPGGHYVAVEATDRILLPELPALGNALAQVVLAKTQATSRPLMELCEGTENESVYKREFSSLGHLHASVDPQHCRRD